MSASVVQDPATSLLQDFTPSQAASRIVIAGHSPRIWFPRRLRQLTYHYTHLDTEFAWLGTVAEIAPLQFLLTELYPTAQEASDDHVRLTADGQLALYRQFAQAKMDVQATIRTLRFWGQSHHKYEVDPSKTDDATFEMFRSNKLPWFIQGIFNRHGNANFKLFLEEGRIVIENAAWIPVDDFDPALTELAQSQIRDNLTVVAVLPKEGDSAEGAAE